MFGTLGVQEMLIIFLVALVLFGPKKLPELGKTIGKALTEFRRASNDLRSTFEREMHTLEREGESIQQAAYTPAAGTHSHSAADPDPYQHWAPPEPEAGTQEPAPAPADTNPTTVGAPEVLSAESSPAAETASLAPAAAPPNGSPGASSESPAPETVSHG